MTDMSAPMRVEPAGDLAGTPTTPPSDEPSTAIIPARPSSSSPSSSSSENSGARNGEHLSHQLSRIEDKTARIEEKYARSEALLLRMGDKVDSAADVMGEAARQADLIALRNEVGALARQTRSLPGAATLLVMAIITAILTAIAVLAALHFGVPGLFPSR